jgi:hypothetical protein
MKLKHELLHGLRAAADWGITSLKKILLKHHCGKSHKPFIKIVTTPKKISLITPPS